jgi:hypothetical protein
MKGSKSELHSYRYVYFVEEIGIHGEEYSNSLNNHEVLL